jgi:ribonuclease HI
MGEKVYRFRHQSIMKVFTDGALCHEYSIGGLAAVFFSEEDKFLDAVYCSCKLMTNNETEYKAVLLAINEAIRRKIRKIAVFSDSQILVNQLLGLASVKAQGLKIFHHKIMLLLPTFELVSFHHISRNENRIADAFANQAILNYRKRGKHEQAEWLIY